MIKGNLLMRLLGELEFMSGKKAREGMITTNGLRLLRPSSNSAPEIKYCAMFDRRMLHINRYHELADFLPFDFEMVEHPEKNRDYSIFCLQNMKSGQLREVHFKEDLIVGDLIKYYPNHGSYFSKHLGIYQGNNRVRSVWITGGPVIEHPLEEFPEFPELLQEFPEEKIQNLVTYQFLRPVIDKF